MYVFFIPVKHLYIESHENSWWIRISINDGVAPNVVPPTGNIVYLVYFVDSEYLLSTRVKSEFKAYIMQVGLILKYSNL